MAENVGLSITEVSPGASTGKINIGVHVACNTGTNAIADTIQVEMDVTDTLAALNTNIRDAVKAWLEANFSSENWVLARYVLFGGGQILL